jgi:hypothetical protein
MKNFIPFILILHVSAVILCQKPIIPYQTITNFNQKVTTNLQSAAAVYGDVYIFGHDISNFYLDVEDSTKIFITTSVDFSTEQIMKLDLNNGKSIFGLKYYPSRDKVRFRDNSILFLNINGLSKFDKNNGELLYELPLKLYTSNEKMDFIMGYHKINNNSKNELLVYSFKTGKFKTSVKINDDGGIESFIMDNDSTVIISASGLHSINLKSGSNWSFEEKTYAPSNLLALPFHGGGLGLGGSIGFYAFPQALSKTFGITSNCLIDGDYIYKSSLDKISCLNKDGNVLWSKGLDDGLTSTAFLFQKNDLLYHLNLGFAFSDVYAVNRGDPFISIYEKKTGKNLGFYLLGSGRSRITDVATDSIQLFTLLDKKFASFQLENLSSSKIIENKTKEFGELQYFERRELFSKKENNL